MLFFSSLGFASRVFVSNGVYTADNEENTLSVASSSPGAQPIGKRCVSGCAGRISVLFRLEGICFPYGKRCRGRSCSWLGNVVWAGCKIGKRDKGSKTRRIVPLASETL